LPGEPDKEALEGCQRSVERCLAQRLAASAAALGGQAVLEPLRLLDAESLEVPIPYKASKREIAFATASLVCSLCRKASARYVK
jgi:hypothetical protein